MAEIIDIGIKTKAEAIWTCACGCTVHYHHENTDIECASCGHVASISDDGWRMRMADLPDDVKSMDETHHSVIIIDSPETWLKRQLKSPDLKNVIGYVVLYEDGGVGTYNKEDFTSNERKNWLMEKLTRARELMSTKGIKS